MRRKILLICLALIFTVACNLALPGMEGTATQTAAPVTSSTATTTVESQPVPPEVASATPGEPVPAGPGQQFIAYIRDGQLLVTDVTNNVQGGTTQYTLSGESDRVMDLEWSPSGEFVAFSSAAGGDPHLFYVFALGQSSPTDLGIGSAPAWSPDSQSIAYIGGAFPDENIWITTIENPAPRQLTFETNHAWGRPVFTPDGESLIVAGASRDTMGASGNTNFTLDYLELDGSGIRTPIPGTEYEGGRLPYDLEFSPDGTRLAFSTSFHLSACASPGAYYVFEPGAGSLQELISPSLQNSIDSDQERYHVGLSYDWLPAGDALVARGQVLDCNLNGPTPGQTLAGPQMSILGLDGSERSIIPGFFWDLSMERTGILIAAARHEDGIEDQNPDIEIYSAETGQLVLALGPGSNPQFQP